MRSKYLSTVVGLAWSMSGVFANCANSCSGHGWCSYVDNNVGVCECDDTWDAAPDCSQRSCPYGTAWTSMSTADNVAHTQQECSNGGTCDRTTGECVCGLLYTGLACERMVCPTVGGQECSGHGECMTLREAGAEQDHRRLTSSATYTTIWDADKIQGCVCDTGYFGYDCSLRQCPFGTNMVSNSGVDEIQIIECTCATTCTGHFYLSFQGELLKFSHDDSATTVATKFAALQYLNGPVTVAMQNAATTICDNDGVTTVLTFTNDPGDLPTIQVESTDDLQTAGAKSVTIVSGDGNNGADGGTSQEGTKERKECSGRGLCDYSTGRCTCGAYAAGSGGTFGSSDGAGASGFLDDCGYASVTPTQCVTVESSMCSGHGTCTGTVFECACDSGYTGYDCSLYECPTGLAWFDEPSATDTAHAAAECSNRGKCDRTVGVCECQEGFTGTACERTICTDDCNDQGQCYSMAQLGTVSESNGDLLGTVYGTNGMPSWDHAQLFGCYCDTGYYAGPYSSSFSTFTTHDCSIQTCPFGDNPQTTNQVNEIQTVLCTATAGKFRVMMRQVYSTWINFDDDVSAVKEALLRAYTIGQATVSFSTGTTACSVGGTTITINFHVPGDLPMLTGDDTYLTGTLTISEVQTGTTEYIECSGQGICDRETGVCTCFPGFISSDGSGDGVTGGHRGDCGAMNVMAIV